MIFFLMNIKTYLKNNMIVKNNNSHHLRVPKANKKFPEDNFAVRNWNFLPCVNGGHIYIYIYIYIKRENCPKDQHEEKTMWRICRIFTTI
jgi:hypothetical protein